MNGTRGGALENGGAEPFSPRASSPGPAERPPHVTPTSSTPTPGAYDRRHDANRTPAPSRGTQPPRQEAPGGTPPQARPFVQRPRAPRDQPPSQRPPHYLSADAALPRTSGSHARPGDHLLPPAADTFRPYPAAPGPRLGGYSNQGAESELRGAQLQAERASTARNDDSAGAEPAGPNTEYDGYRHTQHEPIRPEVRGEVGPLIEALHDLFERDRGVASQGSNARCGICYLHFPLADLTYREDEGFYVCAPCATALGHTQVFMVRRQQK